MSAEMQSIAAGSIVLLTAAGFAVRWWRKRKKAGCGGCGTCGAVPVKSGK